VRTVAKWSVTATVVTPSAVMSEAVSGTVRTFQPPSRAVAMTCSAVRQSRVVMPRRCQASVRAVKKAAVPSSKVSIS
jgi:hypothetical protein